MSSSLDTKRAALHDISNKGGLPGGDKVREPRAVLKEFGVDLDPSVEIKLWDSSAQIRWMVLPERPAGTDNMSEAELAALLTPEAMMGVAKVAA